MTTLAQILSSQSQKELTANENFAAVAPAGLFARRYSATGGLTWAYYGGVLLVDGVPTVINDGSVTLAASATNYIEATRGGAVYANTTGWTAGRIPLYTAVTSASGVTAYTDYRSTAFRPLGRLAKSVAGGANVTLAAAEARCEILEFSGALTASISVIVPAVAAQWIVYNATSGAYTLTVKTAAGSGISIPQGKRTVLYCDGTNVVDAAAAVANGEVTLAKLADFSHDPLTTSGLTFGYRAGRVRNDNAVTAVAAGTVSLTDNATNYVEVTPAGTVLANTSGFTSGRIPLYAVVAAAGAITDVMDARAWLAAGGAGTSGNSIPDFDEDPATTTGLTWGYNGGLLRNANVITVGAAGTVTLTDDATNYVEIDSSGAVSTNTTGFTAGRIPLRQVTTASGAITVSTDTRAWLQFAADMKSDGSVAMTGPLQMDDNPIKQPRLEDYAETLKDHGTVTTATTLNFSDGNHHRLVAGVSPLTLSLGNVPPAPCKAQMTVEIQQDATGSRAVTLPTAEWAGGAAPTLSTAANARDELVLVATRPPGWAAATAYAVGARVSPSTWNGYLYECTTAGTSGASEPTWPTTPGNTVSDGTVTWTCRKAVRGYLPGLAFS